MDVRTGTISACCAATSRSQAAALPPCALQVCNALAMEALPLVLDRLADPMTAIVISVTAVLLCGKAGGD